MFCRHTYDVLLGPISVTIHVSLLSLDILVDLHTMYTSSPDFSTYVDVHLVLSPFQVSEGSRQFNAWRNLARLYARTDFVMMLDVDFVPCTDFRSFIKHNLKDHLRGPEANDTGARKLIERFIRGNLAFVVPAFEYARQEDGLNPETFPRNKAVSYLTCCRSSLFDNSLGASEPGTRGTPTNHPVSCRLGTRSSKHELHQVLFYSSGIRSSLPGSHTRQRL